MLAIHAAISGLFLGGVYAAIAIGLGLVWGVMKILNIAHAALALLGAYLCLTFMDNMGMDPIAALVFSVPILFGIGALLQRTLIRPLESRGNFETQTFLVLYGVMVMVENICVYFWKTDVRLISPSYAGRTWVLVGTYLPVGRVIAFGLGLGALAVVYSFLKFSRMGLAVRALGFDRDAASMVGINANRTAMVAVGLATATAAVAGVALGLVSSFYPGLQIVWISKAFLVVVLGGIANIPGLLVAALGLGVVESVVGAYEPSYASEIAAYAVLILVLMFRPQGLLGAKV